MLDFPSWCHEADCMVKHGWFWLSFPSWVLGWTSTYRVGGGEVHTLTCNERGECVVFRAHFPQKKKKAANFYFRSDLGTKILNFIPVSESIPPKVACTPGDQTSVKFSLLVVNSILLLFEYKAGSAVERLSFKIPSPWVTALSILPAYMGFVTSVTTPGPGNSQMRIPRKKKGRNHPTARTEPFKTPEEVAGLQFILKAN